MILLFIPIEYSMLFCCMIRKIIYSKLHWFSDELIKHHMGQYTRFSYSKTCLKRPLKNKQNNEPVHEISNSVVCETSKASDQPAHTCSPLTEHHLEFLSLKGGCRGSSESTLVKLLEISCTGSNVLNTDYRFMQVKSILRRKSLVSIYVFS